MRSGKIHATVFLFILLNTCTFVIHGAENPWFVNLGYGLSEIDSPLEVQSLGFLPDSVGASSGFENDDSLTFTIGHWFGENWGMQLSYLEFGDFGSKSVFDFNGGLFFFQQSEVNIDGLNLSLFGEIPINDRWAVRGKVGVFAYASESGFIPQALPLLQTTDVVLGGVFFNPFSAEPGITPRSFSFNNSLGVAGASLSFSDSSNDGGQKISFSIGGVYKINDRYSLTLDYSQFNNIDDTDIDLYRVGLSYRF